MLNSWKISKKESILFIKYCPWRYKFVEAFLGKFRPILLYIMSLKMHLDFLSAITLMRFCFWTENTLSTISDCRHFFNGILKKIINQQKKNNIKYFSQILRELYSKHANYIKVIKMTDIARGMKKHCKKRKKNEKWKQ